MRFGLRQKLGLGFGGLFLVILIIGVQGIVKVSELGQSIDVILRENYRSVIACQDMNDAMERVDSGILFVLLGYEKEGTAQIDANLVRFDKALGVEGGNLTLPREGEFFTKLDGLQKEYKSVLARVRDAASPVDQRRAAYFATLLPLFQQVKDASNGILQMNQQNMSDANMAARDKAEQASQRMYLLLLCGVVLAGTFIWYTGRWILRPITALTDSANEIARGNLDLVVGSVSHDELGQLAASFDTMAASLREYRRTNETRMVRMQRAAQQALDNLSVEIVVVDLNGVVEVVTKSAQEAFGLAVGSRLQESKHAWMDILAQQALHSGHKEVLAQGDYMVQVFVGGEERFYRPEAIPVLDGFGQLAGITLMMHDATRTRQQDELKRGLVSTVSHQLKTPLTSIRMALYLLVDDKLGPLTEKQEELLLAAREDSDRLNAIVEDLLDIARIQSGRVQMDAGPVNAATLALDSAEPFKSQAQDRGLALTVSIPAGLPEVQADTTRVPHVFANLLSNAIKHTSPGDSIALSARADDELVWYSVTDTGSGISSEHLSRVFEQFFRVPDQGTTTGAGLGLAIAKEIVEAHGGSIRAQSTLGVGSTFTFSLKRADRAVAKET